MANNQQTKTDPASVSPVVATLRVTPESTDDVKRAALFTKLLNIMEVVQNVPKNGWNSFHQYNYSTESDIKAAVQPALVANRLVFFPYKQEVVEIVERGSTTDRQGRAKEKHAITKTRLFYRWIDTESGYTEEGVIDGMGADSDDKGVWKAYTGQLKYVLSNTFLFSSGDLDPEYDQREPEPQGNGYDDRGRNDDRRGNQRENQRENTQSQRQQTPNLGNGQREQPQSQNGGQSNANQQRRVEQSKPAQLPAPQPAYPEPLQKLLAEVIKGGPKALDTVNERVYSDLRELAGEESAVKAWSEALRAANVSDVRQIDKQDKVKAFLVSLWSANPHNAALLKGGAQ